MSKEVQETKFSGLMRFFIFCSAADIELLKKCPKSEHQKYAGVGATVFFTGLLACASGGYALYTAFKVVWLSLLLGVFWGLLVFNLDRFLVSTMKKSRGKLTELFQITPRLLLAVLLAIVISTPLELKILRRKLMKVFIMQVLKSLIILIHFMKNALLKSKNLSIKLKAVQRKREK